MNKFFNKILDEEYILIKAKYKDTVERFQQMPNLCDRKLSLNKKMAYNCKKNGIFQIGYGSTTLFEKESEVIGTYRIIGEVVLLNGKTVIKLSSCFKTFWLFIYLLSSFLTVCVALFLINYTFLINKTVENISPFRFYYMIIILFLL